jgi:hypothetical protein
MAAESTSMKSLLSQLLSYLPFATANETDHTEQKTEQKTDPNDKLQTDKTNDRTTQPTNNLTDDMVNMGVIPDNDDTVLYCHDLPEAALFTEIENSNITHFCTQTTYRTVTLISVGQ